jgi:hypothetical protein
MTHRVNLGESPTGDAGDANECLVCLSMKRNCCFGTEKVVNKSNEYGCACKAMFHHSCWKAYTQSFQGCPWCRKRAPRDPPVPYRYDIAINREVDVDDTHDCSVMCCVSFFYGVVVFSLTVSGMEKSNGDLLSCLGGGLILLIVFSWISFCCMCMCSPRRLIDRDDPYGENLPPSPCLTRWLYAKVYMAIVSIIIVCLMVYVGIYRPFNSTLNSAAFMSGGYVLIGICALSTAAFKLFFNRMATMNQVN